MFACILDLPRTCVSRASYKKHRNISRYMQMEFQILSSALPIVLKLTDMRPEPKVFRGEEGVTWIYIFPPSQSLK